MPAVIEVDGLRRRYGAVAAVDGISFQVQEREIFGIVGPNGAGKTTTVECLEGLRRPDGGRLRVLGLDPARDGRRLRQRIGAQFQQAALPNRLKVWEALDLYASFYRRARPWPELLAKVREAAVLGERQRLAREIHDTLAQGLTGIVTQLEAAEEALEHRSDAARGHLDAARRLARDSLGEARRSVQALRPRPLEEGRLVDALASVADGWTRDSGVAATVTTVGEARPLPSETEVTLLRVAQEALTNAGRHAGASAVALTLSYTDGTVSLDVTDDGVGFDAAVPAAGRAGRVRPDRDARAGGRAAGQPRRGEPSWPGHHHRRHAAGRTARPGRMIRLLIADDHPVVRDGLRGMVAARLHVSEATVKTHLVHAFGKLGVSDRTAAVAVALERRLFRLD